MNITIQDLIGITPTKIYHDENTLTLETGTNKYILGKQGVSIIGVIGGFDNMVKNILNQEITRIFTGWGALNGYNYDFETSKGGMSIAFTNLVDIEKL